jgi:mannose-6-phosphate isomerase-like protein (cupin superfamily)
MNNLSFEPNQTKEQVFESVRSYIKHLSIDISSEDMQRPWGGFFVIDQASTDRFIETFFPEVDKQEIYQYGKELYPKILVVQPGEQLSWQYHYCRAELWKDLVGPVGVMTSDSDKKPESHKLLNSGELHRHSPQIRHRLIGLDNWGVLAEIWQHTDPNQPSDEEDIIRLEDNYGRN